MISDTTNYGTLIQHFTVIGVALVLASNFVRDLRRIEGFNAELRGSVEEARTELAATLSRQHELELVHARLGERPNLAHDLRDDLRLIIDTASAQHYGEHSLAELLAPLRHRTTRLFEARRIDARWSVSGLEDVYLTTTQSLDLLRILQEALTNVFKHSGAGRVHVELHGDGGTLRMEVADNGNGLPSAGERTAGTGMRSMQTRARRLGATLSFDSQPGATMVRFTMPLSGQRG